MSWLSRQTRWRSRWPGRQERGPHEAGPALNLGANRKKVDADAFEALDQDAFHAASV